MIVRAVSDETLITTRKYVLMIARAAIFNHLFRVYCSLNTFLSRSAKRNEQMHFLHTFNVYSTFGYRFGRNGSRLDATADIAYDNGYNGHNDHSFQKGLKMSLKYLDIYK